MGLSFERFWAFWPLLEVDDDRARPPPPPGRVVTRCGASRRNKLLEVGPRPRHLMAAPTRPP